MTAHPPQIYSVEVFAALALVQILTSVPITPSGLIALSLGMFIVVMDPTMMNVAVEAIARNLNTEVSGVEAAISL